MTLTDRYLDLIDAAYGVSEDPDRIEDLMSLAARYLFAIEEGTEIAGDLPRYAGLDDRLETHAARLNKLLKESLINADEAPSNPFHAKLQLPRKTFTVTGNLAAEQLLGTRFPCKIDALPFDHKTQSALKRLTNLPMTTGSVHLAKQQVFLATVESPIIRSCLVLIETPDEPAAPFDISISYVDWSPELLEHLSNAFDLSPGETSVLHGFLNRQSQKDIAQARDRSVETIKAQSSAILRKTGCSRMSEVVELSASIAYLLRKSPDKPSASISGPWQAPKENMHILERPDGRTLAYYRYGRGRQPILFIHGYVFGPFFTPGFLKVLEKADLYIIAPSRPGFGHSSPSIDRETFNSTTVDDSVALAEVLGLKDVILAIHQGGASHGFRIAAALKDKVRAMVMISSGIPIDEEKHIPHMDVHARIGAVTCRHAPSVMKMMTQLNLQVYKRKGAKSFWKKYFTTGSVDAAALKNQDILETLINSVYHISQQGAEVWVRDGQAAMGDWQSDFEATLQPQHWLHGAQCPVLKAHFVEDYVSKHTAFEVESLADAGILLMYQNPEKVIAKILEAQTAIK